MTQNEIELIFQGRILDDERTVEECEMCDASVVDIIGKLRGGMQIFARTLDGKSFGIYVSSNDKISDVKIKIQEKIGLHPDEQILVFQGGILENDKTVEEYQIVEKLYINIIPRLRGGMQIFAKIMEGKTVTFEVSKHQKISDIKMKIQEKLGLDPDEQKLVFQGEILEDDRTVDEYRITERSYINVVMRLRGCMQIFAKTMDGRTVALEVSKHEKISDIKKRIQEKIGLDPDEQKLIFRGTILQNYKTVKECEIVEKSVIDIVTRSLITVIAKTSDGKRHQLIISADDKIIDLKKLIEYKTNAKTNDQYLMYNGCILEDDKSIWECEIYNQSIVDVRSPLRLPITVIAKTSNGSSHELRVLAADKIIDLKKLIANKTFTNINDLYLMYKEGFLEDEKSIWEYEIRNQAVIDVYGPLRIPKMTINIRTLDGKTNKIQVTNNEIIASVKKRIQEKFGISKEVRLFYLDDTIKDEMKSVNAYGIRENSVITIIDLP